MLGGYLTSQERRHVGWHRPRFGLPNKGACPEDGRRMQPTPPLRHWGSDDWNETPAKRDAMLRDCEEESNYHRCNGMSNEDVKEHIAPLENYSRDDVLVLSYPCAVYFEELAIEWLPQY
jgi:hypothetical protein